MIITFKVLIDRIISSDYPTDDQSESTAIRIAHVLKVPLTHECAIKRT